MTTGQAIRGAALLLALAAGTAEAQGAGRLVGRVTDGTGRPVTGAVVTVTHADSAARGRTAASGETGGFGFPALPPGPYRVRVERPGFQPGEERVTVEAGERRTLIVRLREGVRRLRERGGAER